ITYSRRAAVEPGPMIIGLNHRTAPVEVRERFWIGESRRAEALVRLSRAEGIEEAIILATCHRTELWLWASDPSLAANSVLRFLTSEYQLQLCDWRNFYRLVEDSAVSHIFTVTCGL